QDNVHRCDRCRIHLNSLDDRFFEAGEIRFYPVNHRIKILDTVGTLLGGGHMIGLVGPKIRYRDGYVAHQGPTLVHDPTADAPSIGLRTRACRDRKSTRLNSSHEWISYAVFCLKKKKQKN